MPAHLLLRALLITLAPSELTRPVPPRVLLCVQVQGRGASTAGVDTAALVVALSARLPQHAVSVKACGAEVAAAGWLVTVRPLDATTLAVELGGTQPLTVQRLTTAADSREAVTQRLALAITEMVRPAVEAQLRGLPAPGKRDAELDDLLAQAAESAPAPTSEPVVVAPAPESSASSETAIAAPAEPRQRVELGAGAALRVSGGTLPVAADGDLQVELPLGAAALVVRLGGGTSPRASVNGWRVSLAQVTAAAGAHWSWSPLEVTVGAKARWTRLGLESTTRHDVVTAFNAGLGVGAAAWMRAPAGIELGLWVEGALWWRPLRLAERGQVLMRESFFEVAVGPAARVGWP